MFGRKKTKTNIKADRFKREAYIPKKKLHKTGRTVPGERGRKKEDGPGEKSLGRKILVIALWISFIGEVIYVLFFAGFFTIAKISVEGVSDGSVLTAEQIRRHAEEPWQGKWLHLIPKNNILLVRSARIEERLRMRYPKLESAQVSKQFPDALSVQVSERPYQILWCSRDECFLVNGEGRTVDAHIFFQYPNEQGTVIRIQDTAEAPLSVDKQVLTSEDQRFVHDLVSDFSLRTGLKIEGAIERPNLYAKEMRIRTDKGFLIFFNTRLSVAESLNTLMLVLEKEIPESEWDKIDYIDVRTENRIYYTRKDRAPEKTEAQKKREEEEERKRKEEEEKNKNSQG